MRIYFFSFFAFIFIFKGTISAQEGCQVSGVVINSEKEGIEHVFICSFDSTDYEMKHKLNNLDSLRNEMIEKNETRGMHSMGLSSSKGEFNFLMGSSRYAIVFHPDYTLKIIERAKFKNPCDFEFVVLENK